MFLILITDPSIKDGHGRNCLHYAFMNSAKGETVEVLLAQMKSLPEYVLLKTYAAA